MQQDEQNGPASEPFHYSPVIRSTRARGQRAGYLRRDRIVIICGLLAVLITIASIIGIVMASNNAAPASKSTQTPSAQLTTTATQAFIGSIPTATPADIRTLIKVTPTIPPTQPPQTGSTLTPTPTNTPTPTSIATPTPTPPTSLSITFTSVYATTQGNATISVKTFASAMLKIHVIWCNGKNVTNPTLRGPAMADASGNYTWSWPATNVCVGQATATVMAMDKGQTVTKSVVFTVH